MEALEFHNVEDYLGSRFDYADGYFNFGYIFFGGGNFNNNIFHQLIYSLVKIQILEDRLYYHDISEIYCHKSFKYLLNCLSIRVVTCSTDTNFIPHDITIKNGAPFTNITSSTIVANFGNLKNPQIKKRNPLPSYLDFIALYLPWYQQGFEKTWHDCL